MNPFWPIFGLGAAALLVAARASAKPRKQVTMPLTPTQGGKTDVIFSLMGLKGAEFDGWKIIEIPGVILPGHGHPQWQTVFNALRDGNGEILPNLLKRYSINFGRIGLVGFSAGSNSGVRQFIKNPKDRAKLAFIVAADGLHANIKPSAKIPYKDSDYWDFQGEVAPYLGAAVTAADGGQPFVMTASKVAAPSSGLTMTRDGITTVATDVGASDWQQTKLDGVRGDARMVENFGTVFTDGNDAAEHIYHASTIIPAVLRQWVFPKL